jgi:hypothetical protein
MLALVAAIGGALKFGLPGFGHPSMSAFAAQFDPPVYHPSAAPVGLEQDFVHKGFKLDLESGNFMGPKLATRTVHEPLVPVFIDGKYVRDERGQTIFLRLSIRDKVQEADAAMFRSKREHLKITYGFRSNLVQADLYRKLYGHGKVAPPGMSFHETGMALDIANWRDAQRYMIEAGFVGGCFGIEEDMVHYSINEITKASDFEEFKRCTFKEIPQDVMKDAEKAGRGAERVGGFIGSHLPGKKSQ